ncbi:MAG: dodecin family protein [Acidimicrobiia bacterium]
MSVAKVIEIKARSDQSFEDAITQGVRKAGESVQHIQAAWVQDQQVLLDEGNITGYQVTLKVTFTVS